MRKITVITVGRSDYGIYRPVLREIQKHPNLKLSLVVAGMHLLEKFGMTVKEIERDGFEIAYKLSIPFEDDSPLGISQTMGAAVAGFAKIYSESQPDLLLILGDRYEMHAAAVAALPFKIPVAHIHGGELTLGAIDNALRFSMTSLSHLHFVATDVYKNRLLQMGEEPWRVLTTGAPALDALKEFKAESFQSLTDKFNLPIKEAPVVVTFHPVTLEFEKTARQIDQLLTALKIIDAPIIFTAVNTDTGNKIISEKIATFISQNRNAYLIANFGPDYYFHLLANSRAMIGNSSSGLIEAPSFGLPVVNIGTRQEGRLRARNVIDVDYTADEIMAGIKQALSPEFKQSLKGLKNPYGDGSASEKIVQCLKTISLDQKLIVKIFIDNAG